MPEQDVATVLEGVNERAPRSELLRIARLLAGKVHAQEDERLGRMQEIEERVRRDYAGRNENLVQVISTSSEAEWADAIDFLDNWKDLLPVAIYRVYDGARTALGRTDEPDEDEPDEVDEPSESDTQEAV